jgi:hypothetical protein
MPGDPLFLIPPTLVRCATTPTTLDWHPRLGHVTATALRMQSRPRRVRLRHHQGAMHPT